MASPVTRPLPGWNARSASLWSRASKPPSVSIRRYSRIRHSAKASSTLASWSAFWPQELKSPSNHLPDSQQRFLALRVLLGRVTIVLVPSLRPVQNTIEDCMSTFDRGRFLRDKGFVFFVSLAFSSAVCAAQSTVDWPAYNGQLEADHYSHLAQINRANVHGLKTVWTFDTGEKGDIQDNPLIIGGTLFAYTPTQKVIALDAATGKLKWKFDSGIEGRQPARGLAYWTDGKDESIFAGVMNFLYCLNARTGQPVSDFGEAGRIDLRKGVAEFRGEDYQKQSIALTSPGVTYKDLIIVGGRNPETHPSPPGDICAFDVHTGALRWSFHTIPHPGEPGYETWPAEAYKTAGAANNWTGMSLDAARGILYAPTGSAVTDFSDEDRT